MQKNFELRKSRSGKQVLPPNPKQWENEHNGLDIRHELGIPTESRLDHIAAFELLDNVCVLPHGDLDVTDGIANRFRNEASSRWSGMCVPCPGGITVVLYNDSHPETRVRSTLMEEFFHLWLGHPPTHLRVHVGKTAGRDFNALKESEAYGSGAASLVPYKPLREMFTRGLSTKNIASHFLVSPELVAFRAKVTKLSRFLRA
jgi:hypothetical protein